MLILDTVSDALVTLGVMNPIDEAAPQDHEFGLKTLNRVISLYNIQGLTITYTEELTISEPTAGWKNTMIIGSGEAIDITPPIEIEGAFFRISGVDYPMNPITLDTISRIAYKSNTNYPTKYFWQKLQNNNIEIRFNYIPSANLELHLYAKMPYIGTASDGTSYKSTDDISWSYGFEKMLMLRLAIELAPSYGVDPSQALVALASEAENIVKAANYKPKTLQSNFGRRRRWPIPRKYLL